MKEKFRRYVICDPSKITVIQLYSNFSCNDDNPTNTYNNSYTHDRYVGYIHPPKINLIKVYKVKNDQLLCLLADGDGDDDSDSEDSDSDSSDDSSDDSDSDDSESDDSESDSDSD